MKAESTLRIHIIFTFLLIFAVILMGRLFFVQIVHGEDFKEKADNQYIVSVPNIFNRGSIFFQERNGNLISAATLKSGFVVYINPSKLKNTNYAYDSINKIIPIDREDFIKKSSKKNDPYEEIAKRVPKELAQKIQNLGLSGVAINKEKWRFYPAGNTASQTLGFIGFSGNVLSGRYGLERYYNDVLERDNSGLYVNFFAEVFSNIADSILKSDNTREGDLVLTIEPTVQKTLENELNSLQEKWGSVSSGGVIINPKTGAVYALSSKPDFDPNNFKIEKNLSIFSNPIVESVYEMGSIIKPLTMAAALDTNSVTAKTTYNDKGYVIVDGARIENYDGKGRGIVSMQQVLNQSLNTGAVYAMQSMGKELFSKYMKKYGIGEETGIEIPNETRGLIDNLQSTRNVEYATAAFGQGIAMTPIETVKALATLGNGGTLITPHIVDRVEYDLGGSHKTYPDPEERVLKKETSEEITRMLVRVVDEALMGGTVALPRYSIAAKTGTAQIANLEIGGYYKNKFLHSFFGYFPAYDPKFLIFLYTVEPKGVKYASHTLTSPFMNITKFLINYYEIPPDR